MEVITIQTEAFQKIIENILEIRQLVSAQVNQNPLADNWLDISEVCRLLKVSKRTLQNYRDNGSLPYSQISGKIYFRAADIQEYLEKHYVKVSNARR